MTNYGVSATGETAAIYEGLDEAFTAASGFIGESPDGVPKAYIQCLVFDADYNDITPDDAHQVITSAALGDASDPEILTLDIAIEEDGYVFIYVTNESLDAYVNFDDISVSISGYEITEMTDYYPFGSIANHWEKEEESYRFGYQGQFAEEDEETGFNHFEARDYDPVIGRWMNTDPYRQHSSPYMSMSNNPIMGVDPDGGFDRWNLNTATGERTHINNDGGDQTQYIHYNGSENAKLTVSGSDFFSGPVAYNSNGGFNYAAFGTDIWSGVPDVYLGHYNAFDLVERYNASGHGGVRFESILAQESLGLARNDMVWNARDFGRLQMGDNRSGFMLGAATGVLPIPSSGIAGILKSFHSMLVQQVNRTPLAVSGITPRGYRAPIALIPQRAASTLSNNSWIRFLQLNRGNFSGSDWLNQASNAYNNGQ